MPIKHPSGDVKNGSGYMNQQIRARVITEKSLTQRW